VNVAAPDSANPFTDVTLSGSFGKGATWRECQSKASRLDRRQPLQDPLRADLSGDYTYQVIYRQGAREDATERSTRPTAVVVVRSA
jgi:hypothetical protein